MRVELNSQLAHAAATDAANAHMRRNNRTAWNQDDYNVAATTKARLLNYCDECCMDAPRHWPTCPRYEEPQQ